MPGSFLCLCPSKAVEAVDENILHRPDKVDLIRAELDKVEFEGKDKIILCLPGGGIAVEGLGASPEVAMVGSFLAVLSGTISNYAYLVRKYFLEELGYERNVSLEAIRQSSPIRDAALLCKLYELLGTGMLPKLRGDFVFCLYDASTVRVLAARDPAGGISLFEGQTQGGSLFISSGAYKPVDTQTVTEIQPGNFKYGWRAQQRKYANPKNVVEQSKTASTSAAFAALKGIPLPKAKAGTKKPKAAVPVVPQGPQLRTKHEIRAWSALMAQEAIDAYEKGVGVVEPPAGHMGAVVAKQKKTNSHGLRKGMSPDDMDGYIRHSKFKPQVLAALLGGPSMPFQGTPAPASAGLPLRKAETSASDKSQTASESCMTSSDSSDSLVDSAVEVQKGAQLKDFGKHKSTNETVSA